MSTYILLKDLSWAKAGSEFTPENSHPDYYNSNGLQYRRRIHISWIENLPDYFIEKEEESPLLHKKYTEEDLRKAFEASGERINDRGYEKLLYEDFEDYLKTIKP